MTHRYHSYRPTLDKSIEACRCGEARRVVPAQTRLDRNEAKEKRDAAVQRVERHVDDEWMRSAIAIGKQIARDMYEFTADEFWKRGLSKPREPRALGPVLSMLQRDGFIKATDRLMNTSQVLRHAAPVRIWKSLIRREVA